MKKIISIALALIMCLCVFSACGAKESEKTPEAASDDWTYIKDKGELIIGITEYQPMNYYEGDTLVGFDTEFAEALCAKLGLTAKFVVIDWNSKYTELQSKNIDCIWNGLTVDEERKEYMDFTQSYLINEQCVVVRSADASGYTDTASFAGKTVVAEEGSAGEKAVAADLAEAKYVAVASQASALLEVKSSTADAAVIDITMARAMTGEGGDYSDLTIVSSIDMLDEEYAIGLRNDSTAVAEFDKIIDELQFDGTLESIAAKYELTELYIK